ncbi:GNAT family N-acetyltransferase [Rhodocaloribacter sp.]
MHIREEEERDHAAVYALNAAAFETPAEARLVEALRARAHPVLSLVAEAEGAVVGRILFTPVTLPEHPGGRIVGLAPMAVAPGHQRQGMGSALVRAGLDRCRELGFGAVVVLGHPAYYPRFGFKPASRFGLGCPYDVPDDVFMALELRTGYLHGASGTIAYHAAFDDLWTPAPETAHKMEQETCGGSFS